MQALQGLSTGTMLGIGINVLVIGYMLYWYVRRGGFKNSMFDTRIESTIGEVEGRQGRTGKVRLKVHQLDRDGEAMVGLELTTRSLGELSLMVTTLTPAQARQLSVVLARAAG